MQPFVGTNEDTHIMQVWEENKFCTRQHISDFLVSGPFYLAKITEDLRASVYVGYNSPYLPY